jgi:hypothetical protein
VVRGGSRKMGIGGVFVQACNSFMFALRHGDLPCAGIRRSWADSGLMPVFDENRKRSMDPVPLQRKRGPL